jgi:hypothetical protein
MQLWKMYGVIFGIVSNYFIVYKAYFVVGEIFVELLGLRMFILLFMPYFRGRSGYFSTGSLWT